MKKTFFLTPVLFFFLAICGFASEASPITLAELYEKSDLIVMAKVTQAVQQGDKDEVTIVIEMFLKGNSPERKYTFTLITRNGGHGLDPALKSGDTGIFFLKQKRDGVEKACWGSVAVFPENHFDLTEGTVRTQSSGPMASWRDYRIRLGQARNIAEYENGFISGYNNEGGLIKGADDFNLGRSDGKLAREGIVPSW